MSRGKISEKIVTGEDLYAICGEEYRRCSSNRLSPARLDDWPS